MNLLFVWLSRLLWDSPIVSKNSPKLSSLDGRLTHLQTPSIPHHSNHSTDVSALWALVYYRIRGFCLYLQDHQTEKTTEPSLILSVRHPIISEITFCVLLIIKSMVLAFDICPNNQLVSICIKLILAIFCNFVSEKSTGTPQK